VAHSNFKVANCFTVAIKYLLYRVNKMATSHKRKKALLSSTDMAD
jgi:hypothetical protein